MNNGYVRGEKNVMLLLKLHAAHDLHNLLLAETLLSFIDATS